MTFDEWYAQAKPAFEKAGLSLPEDIEMMELAHMECREANRSIEEYVKEELKLQGK